jgi:hypothetical protein
LLLIAFWRIRHVLQAVVSLQLLAKLAHAHYPPAWWIRNRHHPQSTFVFVKDAFYGALKLARLCAGMCEGAGALYQQLVAHSDRRLIAIRH